MNLKPFSILILFCSHIVMAENPIQDKENQETIGQKESTFLQTSAHFVCTKEDHEKHPNYNIRRLAEMVESIIFDDAERTRISHINVSIIDGKNELKTLWNQIQRTLTKKELKEIQQRNLKIINIDTIDLGMLAPTTSSIQSNQLNPEELEMDYEVLFRVLKISKANELRVVIQHEDALVRLIQALRSNLTFPLEIKKIHVLNIAQQYGFDEVLKILSQYPLIEEVKLSGMRKEPLKSFSFITSVNKITQMEKKYSFLREKVWLRAQHLDYLKGFPSLKHLELRDVSIPVHIETQLKELAIKQNFEITIQK
jgi:hypothetical protein